MYIDHPQFQRPKSQPNLLCSLLIGIDPMYAYHSQWNRTPTYQLTKSNILDVSRTEGVASNTHRDKSKRNEEKTSIVITFCHLHDLLVLPSEMSKDSKFNERSPIFISSTSRYICISDMHIIDFFLLLSLSLLSLSLVFQWNDHHFCCILLFSSLIVPLSLLTIDKCLFYCNRFYRQ